MNRETLEEMQIPEFMIDEFLQHPWYSPRHETILVQALSELTEVKKREIFIQVALSAEFEEEAFFFQRLATMMVAYHHNVDPLDEIVTIDNRLVMGHTKNHTLVVMHPVSRLSWNSETEKSTHAVQTWASKEHPADNIIVWTSGTTTPQAAKQFAAKGLTVHEQSMEKIMLAKNPEPQETPIPVVASLPIPPPPPADEDITW